MGWKRWAAALTAITLGTLISIGACAGTEVLNSTSSDDVYVLSADVAYGHASRQRLDIYRPSDTLTDASSPVVIFFYGGGWRDGSRDMYEFVASSIAREGYVVVIPDYRLYPEVRFPTFVEDGAGAVAWVQKRIASYGGDPGKIFLAGHSAGAHIASMLAFDSKYVNGAEGDAAAIRGFVGLAGPYDFLPLDEGSYLQDLFPQETREDSQPITHVKGRTSPPMPMLLIHGTADERVFPRNSKHLAEAARAAGGEVTLKLYEDQGHKRVVASLAPIVDFAADTRDDVLKWLRAHD